MCPGDRHRRNLQSLFLTFSSAALGLPTELLLLSTTLLLIPFADKTLRSPIHRGRCKRRGAPRRITPRPNQAPAAAVALALSRASGFPERSDAAETEVDGGADPEGVFLEGARAAEASRGGGVVRGVDVGLGEPFGDDVEDAAAHYDNG